MQEYQKVDDSTLKVVDTTVSEVSFSKDDLLNQKSWSEQRIESLKLSFAQQIADEQTNLDAINFKLSKCDELGLKTAAEIQSEQADAVVVPEVRLYPSDPILPPSPLDGQALSQV